MCLCGRKCRCRSRSEIISFNVVLAVLSPGKKLIAVSINVVGQGNLLYNLNYCAFEAKTLIKKFLVDPYLFLNVSVWLPADL